MPAQWNIQLFAGLAERFGQPGLSLALDADELAVRELKAALIERYPNLGELIRVSFIASNQSYAPDDAIIRAGDELALLPPVSGGGGSDERLAGPDRPAAPMFAVTAEPLSVEAVAYNVIVPENGATLTFIGTTREWTGGQRTVRLEYEAYAPMALKTLRQIGEEIAERWPGALCSIAHRVGVVEIAGISVVIAVSAPHRDACYEASRYAIERLKQIVPIWKKEIWEDGSEWKGHQQGPWNPAEAPGGAQ